jgi:DNA transformation protein and related proteins
MPGVADVAGVEVRRLEGQSVRNFFPEVAMVVSNGFLDLVRELLGPLGHITVKKMFGGASIYADGTLFALVDDDVLYLKADDATKVRYESEGLKPFTYEGQTGPVSMSYWRAPERLYDEPDDMIEWAREAIRVAAKAKMSARPKKSGTKTVVPRPQSKKPSGKR